MKNVLIIILSVLVLALGGYIVYDKLLKDDNNLYDNYSDENNYFSGNDDTLVKVNEDDNFVDIDIKYHGDMIDLDKYVVEFNNNDEYSGKLLNLTVSSINLSGKDYIFKLINHPQSCTEMNNYTDNHNVFYINDTKIYNQNNQACYLESVTSITVINGKYIGLVFRNQRSNYMNVYNSDAQLIDKIDFLNISINDSEIVYSEYEENNGCLVNRYSYNISVDGKPIKTFKEQVNNTTCNEFTGDGCCNWNN